MTDSHCHLDLCDDPLSAADPDLAAIVTVGITAVRSQTCLDLARVLPNVWAAVGIHPNEFEEGADLQARNRVASLAEEPEVVAIGETGFDTHWDRQPLGAQEELFQWHAGLARVLDKPLILHVRDRQGRDDASSAAARAIQRAGWHKGVLHCFNGHEELLKAGLRLSWMVSFAGNLTYRSATPIQEAARRVPEDRLLVETDSPYLSPHPKRERRNIPANVRLTAGFLAELRGCPPDELESLTDANAARLFALS